MEALSVDMGRLKSGEVNLGVRFSNYRSEDGEVDLEVVRYIDVYHGRAVQGRGHHRC